MPAVQNINDQNLCCLLPPAGYVFWDRVHPTTHTHQLLASDFVAFLQAKGWLPRA